MLKKRILTALVLIPLILAVIYGLPPIYFPFAVGIVVIIAAWEWAALCGFAKIQSRIIYIICILLTFLLLNFLPFSQFVGIIGGVAVAWWLWSLLFIIPYQRQTKIIQLKRIPFALIGFFVLIPFWGGLNILHVIETEQVLIADQLGIARPHILLFVIIIIALADTGAYFVGKKWGKRHLASRISPGKTWEGLLGGFVTVGFFLPALMEVLHIDQLGVVKLSLLTFVTVLAALLGDLFESFVKRLAGVKDSGTILPGHGGILDRIDSYTAAVPIFMIIYVLGRML